MSKRKNPKEHKSDRETMAEKKMSAESPDIASTFHKKAGKAKGKQFAPKEGIGNG